MAQTEHHGARALDVDRPVDVVDAGRQQQVLAAGQLRVDRLGGVTRSGDVEVGQGQRAATGVAVAPRGAARLRRGIRHPHPVGAAGVDVQPRLLTAERGRLERRVRRVGEGVLAGGAHDSGEDLVPDPVAPAAHLAVADQPLLLRAVDDVRRPRVGDETATRVLRPGGAVVHQRDVRARHVDPAHRDRLAHRPEVRAPPAAVLPGRVDPDRQVRQRAPEVVQRDAVAGAAVREAAVVDLDLAVDDHVTRLRAQPRDLGVVADLDLQRLAVGAVRAGPEEQAPPVRAHLVVDLRGTDRIGCGLDLTRRHARVEDQHARPEPAVGAQGRVGRGRHPRCRCRRLTRQRGCRPHGGCRQRTHERGPQDEPAHRPTAAAHAGREKGAGPGVRRSHVLTFRRHPAPMRSVVGQPHHGPGTPARRAVVAVEPTRRVRRPGRGSAGQRAAVGECPDRISPWGPRPDAPRPDQRGQAVPRSPTMASALSTTQPNSGSSSATSSAPRSVRL